MFFSFIGFDAASTAGEEARNPKRDLPRAIMISLLVVTAVYVLVAFAAVGAVGPAKLGESEASLATALEVVTGQGWPATLLALGAVLAIATVVLTVLYGQTRILVSMSRDGLVPAKLAQVNRRSVPGFNTLLVGGVVALLAAVVPLSDLTDATSIGTLVAFGIVNIGVVVLRYRKPDLDRSFRTPLMPWVPLIGVALCVYLVLGLDAFTWAVFGVWMLVGLVVYFAYGMPRSKLNRAAG